MDYFLRLPFLVTLQDLNMISEEEDASVYEYNFMEYKQRKQ